jgi:hypothetical protein
MRKGLIVAGVLILALFLPSAARADGFVNPFIGVTFNPSAGTGIAEENHTTYGVSLGSMGGVAGFELDFGYTPDFFGEFGDNNVTTLMANLMLSVPADQGGAGLRPYASGGVGLLKTRVEDPEGFFDLDNNDFGMNLGFGVIGFMSRGVGIRGDVRYFRNLSDDEEDNEFDIDIGNFSFWRGTVGLTLRF